MSRFMVTDITEQDPRALVTAEKISCITDIVAPTSQYLTATGINELTVKGGCVIAIGGSGIFKTVETLLSTGDLDVGGSFIVGKNYYVYICDLGEKKDEKYVISMNSTYPSGYTAATSRKIGGFHYGVNRRTSAKLQPINGSNAERGTGWESNVYNAILPRSVWTLTHRPKCSPEGMVYQGSGVWVDIYLASDDGAGGVASVYNATPLTGTEGLDWYEFAHRGLVVGKRLLSNSEWINAADGSPQGLDANNTNAWSATTNTGRQLCGYVQNAVSSIGCRDCVGNIWEWLDEFIHDPTAAAPAWYDPMSGKGQGQLWMYSATGLHALIAGGSWGEGVRGGARCVSCSHFPWYVYSHVGARFACESL